MTSRRLMHRAFSTTIPEPKRGIYLHSATGQEYRVHGVLRSKQDPFVAEEVVYEVVDPTTSRELPDVHCSNNTLWKMKVSNFILQFQPRT